MDSRSESPSPDPSREPLTRRRILECSLKIIDRDGLESLSMRRLTERQRTLYAYDVR